MANKNEQQAWDEYKNRELKKARRLAEHFGYHLDEAQVHTGGERYLMTGIQDVGGGGKKLVLIGTNINDGKKVVIKYSSDQNGIKEIEQERRARETVAKIPFSYIPLLAPAEIAFQKKDGAVFFVTEYISEKTPLLKQPIQKQFRIALDGLKMQEGSHAIAHSHTKHIEKTLGLLSANDYIRSMDNYIYEIERFAPDNRSLVSTLAEAMRFFHENKEDVDRYCGFLTHADFAPHNLRIKDDHVYLLDFASVHFGNKYESWARLLNYMVLYNQEIEQALTQYVKINRSKEEYLSLRLMRVYKLVFLLHYYVISLHKTSGNLQLLTRERISFWTQVLNSVLQEKEIPSKKVDDFKKRRDSLRSSAEIARQKELHQLF